MMKTSQHRRLRTLAVLGSVALLSLTAACSSSKSSGKPFHSEGIGNNGVPSGSPTAPPQPCGPEATKTTWPGALPAANAMPSGTTMAKIHDRGFLVAGVDMSTWLFGYDPKHTNVPQGFDIDIAKQIAVAIFGDANPNHIKFQVVTLADPKTGEVAQLTSGSVDVVVRTTTITCARLQNANFSNPYYTAHQQLLMPLGADGKPQALALADMKTKPGQLPTPVCATLNSTAYNTIVKVAGQDAAYPAANALDCLVYLQQNKVAAIFTDDAILRGMEAQDPKVHRTTAPPPADGDQPYGIVTAKDSTDMAKFVNGVLAKTIDDGTWAQLFASDLQQAPDGTPRIPDQYPLG